MSPLSLTFVAPLRLANGQDIIDVSQQNSEALFRPCKNISMAEVARVRLQEECRGRSAGSTVEGGTWIALAQTPSSTNHHFSVIPAAAGDHQSMHTSFLGSCRASSSPLLRLLDSGAPPRTNPAQLGRLQTNSPTQPPSRLTITRAIIRAFFTSTCIPNRPAFVDIGSRPLYASVPYARPSR